MSTSPDVLSAGIVVADHICTPIDHLPLAGELVMADRLLLTLGGCAANTAVDLAKMGVATRVVGRIGDDLFGRVVQQMLTESHVDPSGLAISPGRDTSQTLIVNVVGQDRRFIHTFGANADFTAADIPADFGGAKVLYVGGFFVMDRLVPGALAEVFASARRAGVTTVLDVVTPGPGRDYVSALRTLLPHTDVFLPNTDEARLMTGEPDPLQQALLFREMGVGTVVITCGGDGAVLVNERERLRADAYSVAFVDASGGGDAFDAGYIVGLLRGLPTEECLRMASALGASCVRAIGTTPGVFTRDECEAFLREQPLRVERV